MSPRFLLVLGHRSGERLVPPWPGASRPNSPVVADQRTWVAWRLVGSNHREVARSAGVYPALDGCVAAIADLRRALDADDESVAIEVVNGMWSWIVSGTEGPLAVASRLYQRQRECAYSYRVFRETAPGAELSLTPAQATPAPRPQPVADLAVAAE